jgi:hypothetical protein
MHTTQICTLDENVSNYNNNNNNDNNNKFDFSRRASGSNDIDQDLLVFIRETFLNITKARYKESIETDRIGSSATAAKLLLHSIDVANDCIHDKLEDWDCIASSLTSSFFC